MKKLVSLNGKPAFLSVDEMDISVSSFGVHCDDFARLEINQTLVFRSMAELHETMGDSPDFACLMEHLHCIARDLHADREGILTSQLRDWEAWKAS